MRRQAGFTLIEVLAALAVTIATLALTISLGERAVQHVETERFFTTFTREWAVFQRRARSGRGGDVWFSGVGHRIEFDVFERQPVVLRLPAHLNLYAGALPSPLKVRPGQLNAPFSISFRTSTGRFVRFTVQFGWGVLVRKSG